MKTLKRVLFLLVLLFTHYFLFAQTCNGNTFNSPGAPSTCTYTYDSGSWDNTPPSNISDGDSVCILDNNSTDFGTFKGDMYIAEGVTYSGTIGSINGSSTIVVAGIASFAGQPPTAATIYIEETGVFNAIDNSYSPTGTIYNAGTLNASNDVALGGSATVYSYNNATFNVQGDISISKPFSNCGLLEVHGDLSTTGSGGLNNGCSTWIHGDMTINSDYYNDNLIVLEGTINFNGADFYNNDILMVDNINLSGDDLIGNNETSVLIVRNNSTLTSGGTITGHYYYDMDDGGGVDSVCGTCTADIDIVNAGLPNIPADLVADCGNNIIIEPPVIKSTLDFDGIDDYADSDFDLDGMAQATIMGWVKLDSDFGNTSYIIDQGDFEVGLSATAKIFIQVNGRTISVPDKYDFDLNKWYHFTVIFDSSLPSENLKLYVSGEFAISDSHPSLLSPIDTWTSDKLTLGKDSGSNNKYFKGSIDEVRVFNTAITEEQMHQMVHQEIENNSGMVRGKVIPKNIIDFSASATIPWTTLEAYYPMTNIISNTRTNDYSHNSYALKLYNMNTFQEQTAPMPYQTIADGNLTNSGTWLNGNVSDITDNTDTNPWSIIKVSHNVTTANNVFSKGLIIDSGKKLTVTGDKEIRNSWFLELNGTLDLQDDSQLIQTETSDLVTSADGKILRRQEGNTNYFWYNYWSSPVGSQVATTLSENNGPTNNTSNTPFSLNMLKDGSGTPFQFTNAYEEPGKISRYWLYTFQNGVTYYDWEQINQNSAIQPGFGYTQKGTGNTGAEQQYIFEGKPNNGTILVAAHDVAGDSANESETNVTLTTTLIGNPYPSALDAVQFINDNKYNPDTGSGVISGTILLWEQWAGASHYLADYEGGYAFINALATVRAYQHTEIPIADQVIDEGIKTPTFTIPVGQGFFVEVIEDGDIEFNNAQRVFVKESDADGTSNNGSTFFRTTNTETSTNTEEANPFQLIRLEFATSEGSTRRFVLGFGDDATDGYDYGYDGGVVTDLPADDMGSLLNGQQYVIQAFSPITEDKVVDLNINASGNFTYSLQAVELTNFTDGQEIYLRDNLTNTYFDLTGETTYNFTSEAGLFTDRFDVVFKASETLATEEFTNDNTLIYVNQLEHMLYVKALTNQAKGLSMTNMLGQTVKAYNTIDNQTLENGINISDLSSGVYIVSVQTENNISIDKRVIIN